MTQKAQFTPLKNLDLHKKMTHKKVLIIAGILGAIAVIMGAMGAHALETLISPNSLKSYLTGARYNMVHAITLVALAGNQQYIHPKWFQISTYTFLIGTLLFSGSIYLLSTSAITGIEAKSVLGPITPIGGLVLISGWVSIVIGAIQAKK